MTLITGSDLSGPQGVAVDGSGNYIVAEYNTQLSKVTPGGTVTFIANIYSGPGVAIDSSGNYVVTQQSSDRLSLVTPGGTVTVITSSDLNRPTGVAIESRQSSRPSNPTQHVGGQLFTANKLVVLSPYLALIGVVTVAAFVLKRQKS